METLIAAGAFVIVFLAVVGYLMYRRYKLVTTLSKLDAQREALTKLAHALEYLSKEGSGYNLEWTNARCIIENAMYEVLA